MEKIHAAVLRVVDGLWETYEWVPLPEIEKRLPYSRLKIKAAIRQLEKRGLLSWRKNVAPGGFPGVKLTEKALEYLAVRDLELHGIIDSVGGVIGEGKEAVVRLAFSRRGLLVLKMHRFSRAEFRKIKRSLAFAALEWWRIRLKRVDRPLHFARAKAQIEYYALEKLFGRVRVPKPIAINRNVVVMEFFGRGGIPAPLLASVGTISEEIAEEICKDYIRAVKEGFIHGDFSPYNILYLDGDFRIIDWPQAVPVNFEGAEELYERDIRTISTFFQRSIPKFRPEFPAFSELLQNFR